MPIANRVKSVNFKGLDLYMKSAIAVTVGLN